MLRLTGLVLILAGLAAPAQAFERHWTVNGPRGTSTAEVERYCIDGVCYANVEFIGPHGRITHTSSVCTRTAPHVWNCTGTIVGPRSGSRSGAIQILVN